MTKENTKWIIKKWLKRLSKQLNLQQQVGLGEDKLKALQDDLEQASLDTLQKQCNYKQNKLSALLKELSQ